MNRLEAKSTLETPARGVDPATREILFAHGPSTTPQVTREFFLGEKELDKLCQLALTGFSEFTASRLDKDPWVESSSENRRLSCLRRFSFYVQGFVGLRRRRGVVARF